MGKKSSLADGLVYGPLRTRVLEQKRGVEMFREYEPPYQLIDQRTGETIIRARNIKTFAQALIDAIARHIEQETGMNPGPWQLAVFTDHRDHLEGVSVKDSRDRPVEREVEYTSAEKTVVVTQPIFCRLLPELLDELLQWYAWRCEREKHRAAPSKARKSLRRSV